MKVKTKGKKSERVKKDVCRVMKIEPFFQAWMAC